MYRPLFNRQSPVGCVLFKLKLRILKPWMSPILLSIQPKPQGNMREACFKATSPGGNPHTSSCIWLAILATSQRFRSFQSCVATPLLAFSTNIRATQRFVLDHELDLFANCLIVHNRMAVLINMTTSGTYKVISPGCYMGVRSIVSITMTLLDTKIGNE